MTCPETQHRQVTAATIPQLNDQAALTGHLHFASCATAGLGATRRDDRD